MITFIGEQIKCGELHDAFVVETPEAKHRTARFFGVNGESRISGGIGGRMISSRMWIFDPTWLASDEGDKKLLQYLRRLENKLNTGGKLEMTGILNDEYRNCVLVEVERSQELTPRIDEIGVMVPGEAVWWCEITLKFRQLAIDAEVLA